LKLRATRDSKKKQNRSSPALSKSPRKTKKNKKNVENTEEAEAVAAASVVAVVAEVASVEAAPAPMLEHANATRMRTTSTRAAAMSKWQLPRYPSALRTKRKTSLSTTTTIPLSEEGVAVGE
jgi:hypothetical protein